MGKKSILKPKQLLNLRVLSLGKESEISLSLIQNRKKVISSYYSVLIAKYIYNLTSLTTTLIIRSRMRKLL